LGETIRKTHTDRERNRAKEREREREDLTDHTDLAEICMPIFVLCIIA